MIGSDAGALLQGLVNATLALLGEPELKADATAEEIAERLHELAAKKRREDAERAARYREMLEEMTR